MKYDTFSKNQDIFIYETHFVAHKSVSYKQALYGQYTLNFYNTALRNIYTNNTATPAWFEGAPNGEDTENCAALRENKKATLSFLFCPFLETSYSQITGICFVT